MLSFWLLYPICDILFQHHTGQLLLSAGKTRNCEISDIIS